MILKTGHIRNQNIVHISTGENVQLEPKFVHVAGNVPHYQYTTRRQLRLCTVRLKDNSNSNWKCPCRRISGVYILRSIGEDVMPSWRSSWQKGQMTWGNLSQLLLQSCLPELMTPFEWEVKRLQEFQASREWTALWGNLVKLFLLDVWLVCPWWTVVHKKRPRKFLHLCISPGNFASNPTSSKTTLCLDPILWKVYADNNFTVVIRFSSLVFQRVYPQSC